MKHGLVMESFCRRRRNAVEKRAVASLLIVVLPLECSTRNHRLVVMTTLMRPLVFAVVMRMATSWLVVFADVILVIVVVMVVVVVVVVETPLVVKFVVLVVAVWIKTWPLGSFFVGNIVANVAEVVPIMALVAKVPVIEVVPVIAAVVVLVVNVVVETATPLGFVVVPVNVEVVVLVVPVIAAVVPVIAAVVHFWWRRAVRESPRRFDCKTTNASVAVFVAEIEVYKISFATVVRQTVEHQRESFAGFGIVIVAIASRIHCHDTDCFDCCHVCCHCSRSERRNDWMHSMHSMNLLFSKATIDHE